MKYEQACLEQCKKMSRVFCQPVVDLQAKFKEINLIKLRVKEAVVADLKNRGEFSPDRVSFFLSDTLEVESTASVRLYVL
mmetsp:Transcript_9384/g.14300  ORF Transcript_9384/g.14300 Transcript_9384/m.14300 type:complete len:80 (+) Transcript_9384:405-644(+)